MSSWSCSSAAFPVALERERPLLRLGAAVEPVENVETGTCELRRVQEPPEEGARLRGAAEAKQRVDREGRVPHPAVAVVPVPLPSDPLRKRSRRGGCDRAGGRIEEELQRERAADDRLLPGTVVRAAARPLPPKGFCRVDPLFDIRAGGKNERLPGGGAESEQRPRALHGIEAPTDRRVLDRRLTRVPAQNGESIASRRRNRNSRAAGELRSRCPIAEARLDPPAHRHASRNPLDPAGELTEGRQPAVGERHRVRDSDRAGGSRECRLKDVRAREVTVLGLEGLLRREREAATPSGVEKRPEDRWRVEVGQAKPVDGAVTGDESDGTPVTDGGVVSDRRVALDAFGSRFQRRPPRKMLIALGAAAPTTASPTTASRR
jgi:hypothetical protein